jgi:hypothetical protein
MRLMKHKKILFVLPVLLLIIVPSVFAVSTSFFSNAQKWYSSECTKRPDRVKGEKAVLCYSFDKLSEVQSAISVQDQRIQELESEVELLENRIEVLENTSPSPSIPASKTGVFSVDTPVNVSGYSRIVVTIKNGGSSSNAIFYSDDQVNWTLQSKFGENFGSLANYKFPVKGKYYKITIWDGFQREFEYFLDNAPITAPVSDFTIIPGSPKVGQQMTFTNTSTGASQFRWEFGGVATFYSTDSVINFTPSSTGPLTVLLYTRNLDGVEDTKSFYANVAP